MDATKRLAASLQDDSRPGRMGDLQMPDDDEATAAIDLLAAAVTMRSMAKEVIARAAIDREAVMAVQLVEIAAKFEAIAEEWLVDLPSRPTLQ